MTFTDPTMSGAGIPSSIDPTTLSLATSPYQGPTGGYGSSPSLGDAAYYPFMSQQLSLGLPPNSRVPAAPINYGPAAGASQVAGSVPPTPQSNPVMAALAPGAYTAGGLFGASRILPRILGPSVDMSGVSSLGNLARGAGYSIAGNLAANLLGGALPQSTPAPARGGILGAVRGVGEGAALSPLLGAALPNLENPLGWAILAGAATGGGLGAAGGGGGLLSHLPSFLRPPSGFGHLIGMPEPHTGPSVHTPSLAEAQADIGHYYDVAMKQTGAGNVLSQKDYDAKRQELLQTVSQAYSGKIPGPDGKPQKINIDKTKLPLVLNQQVDQFAGHLLHENHVANQQAKMASVMPMLISQQFQPLANQMVGEMQQAADVRRPLAEQITAGVGKGSKRAGPETQSLALQQLDLMVSGARNLANAYQYQAVHEPQLLLQQQQAQQATALANAMRSRQISNYVNQVLPSTSSNQSQSINDIISQYGAINSGLGPTPGG